MLVTVLSKLERGTDIRLKFPLANFHSEDWASAST